MQPDAHLTMKEVREGSRVLAGEPKLIRSALVSSPMMGV